MPLAEKKNNCLHANQRCEYRHAEGHLLACTHFNIGKKSLCWFTNGSTVIGSSLNLRLPGGYDDHDQYKEELSL